MVQFCYFDSSPTIHKCYNNPIGDSIIINFFELSKLYFVYTKNESANLTFNFVTYSTLKIIN